MDAVQKAISSLSALATPHSQIKLAARGANASDRYLLVALLDRRWLAIDRHDLNKAYLLNKQLLAGPRNQPLVVELQGGGLAMLEEYTASSLSVQPAPDGDYPFQASGKIIVKRGQVAEVVGTPSYVWNLAAP